MNLLRDINVFLQNDAALGIKLPHYTNWNRKYDCRKGKKLNATQGLIGIKKNVIILWFQAPSSATKSVKSLIRYLVAIAETDVEKVRAFYRWITANIRSLAMLYVNIKCTCIITYYMYMQGYNVCDSKLHPIINRGGGVDSVMSEFSFPEL